MGRCGCSSVAAVGCSAAATDCVDVTGAGTPGSPFEFSPIVDPDPTNRLSCSASGLAAFVPLGLETVGPIDGSGPVVGSSWPADFSATQFKAVVGSLLVNISDSIAQFSVSWPAFPNGVAAVLFSPGSEVIDPHTNAPPVYSLIGSPTLSGADLICAADDDVATPQNPSTVIVELLVIGW